MKTETQIAEEIRKSRELKLERIILYSKWRNRPVEEKHLDWEHWMLLRKLRRESEKPKKEKTQSYNHDDVYIITSFNEKVHKPYWMELKSFEDYILRLNREFIELDKYDTWTLLYNYKFRFRPTSYIDYDGVEYLVDSVKYVLDTREHITIKKKKRIHMGKKDKKHGRKNPTNKR